MESRTRQRQTKARIAHLGCRLYETVRAVGTRAGHAPSLLIALAYVLHASPSR
jgi:hypothetical protein